MKSLPETEEIHPSILILHFHSTRNAGDAAQLASAVEDLKETFGQVRLIVSANYPQEEYLRSLPIEVVPSISSLIGLGSGGSKARLTLNLILAASRILAASIFPGKQDLATPRQDGWSELLHAYRTSDLVLSTPGNIFFTRGRIGFIASALAVIPAICTNKPMYVLPQSIGPLHRAWERLLVKWLYSSARLVFVREPRSLGEAVELGIARERVVLTHDQSLTFPKTKTKNPPQVLLDAGFDPRVPAVGVSVIPNFVNLIQPYVLESYYAVMANSLAGFAQENDAHVYFFPQVTGPSTREDDRLAAMEVIKLIPSHAEKVKIIDQSLNPEELKACYQWMEIFIASRLHSAIFSMSSAVPTLMISYLEKTKGAAELFGWQDFTLEISNLTQEELSEKLTLLWDQRGALRQVIKTRLEEILQKYPRPGAMIYEDYRNG